MLENLMYMFSGGLSMMLFISALRNKDLILKIGSMCAFSMIIFLSFYLDYIGAGYATTTIILTICVFVFKGEDDILKELVEAFNPMCEIKHYSLIYYKKYLTLYIE